MVGSVSGILHLDASQRKQGSVSRALSRLLVDELQAKYPDAKLVHRDLVDGVPLVNADWIAANGTPDEARTEAQCRALAQSDVLVDELRRTDVWVIGTPVYNFSLPPVLKAWIDQVCRARVTFAYSEQGPRGLMEDRKVFLAVASGGSKVGSPTEFLTPYLRHVLGFIGVSDVEIIAADQLLMAGEDKVTRARQQVLSAVAAL
ncbi:MAG: NAD(P)H-dependent oxidoreductase [Pseudomonadales bacterium]